MVFWVYFNYFWSMAVWWDLLPHLQWALCLSFFFLLRDPRFVVQNPTATSGSYIKTSSIHLDLESAALSERSCFPSSLMYTFFGGCADPPLAHLQIYTLSFPPSAQCSKRSGHIHLTPQGHGQPAVVPGRLPADRRGREGGKEGGKSQVPLLVLLCACRGGCHCFYSSRFHWWFFLWPLCQLSGLNSSALVPTFPLHFSAARRMVRGIVSILFLISPQGFILFLLALWQLLPSTKIPLLKIWLGHTVILSGLLWMIKYG